MGEGARGVHRCAGASIALDKMVRVVCPRGDSKIGS